MAEMPGRSDVRARAVNALAQPFSCAQARAVPAWMSMLSRPPDDQVLNGETEHARERDNRGNTGIEGLPAFDRRDQRLRKTGAPRELSAGDREPLALAPDALPDGHAQTFSRAQMFGQACSASVAAMATFRDRVREIMRENGYVHEDGEPNLSKFSKDLGLSRSHIGLLLDSETGDPRISTVKKIAEKGRVTLDWLVLGVQPKSIDDAAEARVLLKQQRRDSSPPKVRRA
ncbi:MAG TPA: hypothetical protein VGH28_10405 [Polyangiaceae bacterium]